jgi:predicted nucleic acid-binding protein
VGLQEGAQEAVILLDTSVLSFAFRRAPGGEGRLPLRRTLERLIAEDAPLVVPGVVVHELLSGVRGEAHFARLQTALEGFPVLLADRTRMAPSCGLRGLDAE